MMTDCTFCTRYEKQVGIVYEDTHFFGMFDDFPVSPGHADIVPKRHVATILELKSEEFSHLQSSLERMMHLIEETDLSKLYEGKMREAANEIAHQFAERMCSLPYLGKSPDAYNVGINQGRAAGQTIGHLHIHIIPRYEEDQGEPIGGVRNIIPGMGDYRHFLY